LPGNIVIITYINNNALKNKTINLYTYPKKYDYICYFWKAYMIKSRMQHDTLPHSAFSRLNSDDLDNSPIVI